MACEYFIGDRKFTEQEFKQFLAEEGLDQFLNEKSIDLNKIPPSKPPVKESVPEADDSFPQKVRSFYKNVVSRSKGLTDVQKEILKNDPNALYNTLPYAESRRIARELIEEIGVEKAVLEASKDNTGLAPVERTMLLGAAMDYYAGEAKKFAKEGNEKGLLEAAEANGQG